MWILLFILAIVLVLGNALLLLRTAKIPKIPKDFKAQPYDDDQDDGW